MAESTVPETTRELADFVVRTRFDDLPDIVRREGVRTFVNWAGCSLGGCQHEAVEIALQQHRLNQHQQLHNNQVRWAMGFSPALNHSIK